MRLFTFFTTFFLLTTIAIYSQFTVEDFKKYQDSKKKKSGSFLEKIQDLQDTFKKNEKKQTDFTGGIKYGITTTIKGLKPEDTSPQAHNYLLVADKIDEQYTVFAENNEYAIYRYNNLPPSGEFIQFAVKKEAPKELQKKYKKGTILEKGNYEIEGLESFLKLTFDETPMIVIKMVYVKLF